MGACGVRFRDTVLGPGSGQRPMRATLNSCQVHPIVLEVMRLHSDSVYRCCASYEVLPTRVSVRPTTVIAATGTGSSAVMLQLRRSPHLLQSSPYLGGSGVVHLVSSPALVPTLPTGLLHSFMSCICSQVPSTTNSIRCPSIADIGMTMTPCIQPGHPGSYV
jgi:hypothetical protein